MRRLLLAAAFACVACSTTPATISVAINPTTAALHPGQVQAFAATVTGATNTAVVWSVTEAAGGAIDGTGSYTAPSTAGTFHVVATSVADATKSATAVVTVTLDVTVTIAPTTATLITGATQSFTATVTGSSNTAVTWSVTETSGGSVTSAGVYTAPATGGTYHVVATSVADPTQSATVAVVVDLVSITIDPTSVALPALGTQQFTASVVGTTNASVVWTVTELTGGSVSSSGAYVAPPLAGLFHVVATSAADPRRFATAAVTVPVVVSISPASYAMDPGATHQFSATVTGATNHAVTWSVLETGEGASVDASGLFTAPNHSGVYHLVATSVADGTATAGVEITVSISVSGTITYAGSKSGRVYVSLLETCSNCGGGSIVGGTSLALDGGTGSYTLRGVTAYPNNGSLLELTAWMETTGETVIPLAAVDPIGTDGGSYSTLGSVRNFNVTLVDPIVPAVPTPSQPMNFVMPADSSALVGWNGLSNQSGIIVDHYVIEARPVAAQATDCSSASENGAVFITSPSWLMNIGMFGGANALTNGTGYCFRYRGVLNGVDGDFSADLGPVTINAATTGHTVSGTITDSSFANTGSLYVVAISGGGGPVAFAHTEQTTTAQAYSLTGVPDGTYQLVAFDDPDDLGYLNPNLPNDLNSSTGPQFTVSGAAVTGVDLSLGGQSVAMLEMAVNNYGSYDGNGNFNSNVNYGAVVVEGTKMINTVELLSGDGVVPTDVGLSLNNGGNGGSGQATWQTQLRLAGTPITGTTYDFEVGFADGTSTILSAPLPAAVALVTGVSPANGEVINTAIPTISWTAPSPAPSSYTYQLQVNDSNGNTQWYIKDIPSGTTSLGYNSDGQGSALASGTTYWLQVSVQVGQLEQSTRQSSFSTLGP